MSWTERGGEKCVTVQLEQLARSTRTDKLVLDGLENDGAETADRTAWRGHSGQVCSEVQRHAEWRLVSGSAFLCNQPDSTVSAALVFHALAQDKTNRGAGEEMDTVEMWKAVAALQRETAAHWCVLLKNNLKTS